MGGLVAFAVGAIGTIVAFFLGSLSGSKVTETKITAVVDAASKEAQIRSMTIKADLKDLASQLVSEKPSAQIATSDEKDVHKLAEELLERARSIGK